MALRVPFRAVPKAAAKGLSAVLRRPDLSSVPPEYGSVRFKKASRAHPDSSRLGQGDPLSVPASAAGGHKVPLQYPLLLLDAGVGQQ